MNKQKSPNPNTGTAIIFSTEVWVHLLCWSIFIFSEVVVTGLLRDRFSSFSFYFLFYLLNISLFYFHAHALTAFSKRAGA